MLADEGTSVACGELTVYADDDKDTHRDVMTATAFMSGLLPQCIPTVQVPPFRPF